MLWKTRKNSFCRITLYNMFIDLMPVRSCFGIRKKKYKIKKLYDIFWRKELYLFLVCSFSEPVFGFMYVC